MDRKEHSRDVITFNRKIATPSECQKVWLFDWDYLSIPQSKADAIKARSFMTAS